MPGLRLRVPGLRVADHPSPAQLAALLTRLDDLSHVLAWASVPPAKGGGAASPSKRVGVAPPALAVVELPRVRLSFVAGTDGALHCAEHAGLSLSTAPPDAAVAELLWGVPHGVLLQSGSGAHALLVSAAARPLAAAGGADGADAGGGAGADAPCLLSRNDAAWLNALEGARHYLYPVHPSQALLESGAPSRVNAPPPCPRTSASTPS